MQFDYLYAPLIGGAYARGDTFNTAKPQTLSGALFDPKLYEVNVTEYLEDVEINNKGPLAVFSRVDTDLQNAIMTINAIVDIALYRHGQANGALVSDNRVKQLNGLAEEINNGTDNSWDGNVFTSYGTQARNGAIGGALNGNIFWLGDAAGNPGQLTYATLLNSYLNCRRGNIEPNLGLTNKAGYAFTLERMQVQQRFAQETDPIWGATGVRFQRAMILVDDYCPSLKFGVNDSALGNYLTSTFQTVAAPTANSGLPGTTTVTVGETFFWLNTEQHKFRISNSPLFGFGFKPFVYAANNTQVSGQVLAAVNDECISPWGQAQLFGFNS